MTKCKPLQNYAQKRTPFNAACDPGHERWRYADDARTKANQQSDRPYGDTKAKGKFRQHSCRQKYAETNDKVAQRQGYNGELPAEHLRRPN